MVEQKPLETQQEHRSDPILIGVTNILFLLCLVLNSYVAFSVYDGAQFIRQVESEIGHSLGCYEAYSHREIDSYFYPQHRRQGDAIYLFSMFSPFWIPGTCLLSLWLSLSWKTDRLYRWLPVTIMSVVLLFLVFSLPVIQTISCATE